MQTPSLFAFEGVSVESMHGTILNNITLDIPATGITAIVGPSGSGKSTLLRVCNRLVAPTRGTVRFRGEDLAKLDPLKLRRRVGMVFQKPTHFPGTVLENLRVADPRITDDAAARALEAVQLDPALLDRPAHELSGGESQRMCLARTLVTNPEVVLMDEPTSALDATARTTIEDLTCALVENGTPVILVSHDTDQVQRLASRVITLDRGMVVTP
ncbi:MAG: phosphate ABC transporter ATP-binding protein [Acidimicrobiia bacterium]